MPLGYYTFAIGGTTTAKIDGAQSTTNNGHLLWLHSHFLHCVLFFFLIKIRNTSKQFQGFRTTMGEEVQQQQWRLFIMQYSCSSSFIGVEVLTMR